MTNSGVHVVGESRRRSPRRRGCRPGRLSLRRRFSRMATYSISAVTSPRAGVFQLSDGGAGLGALSTRRSDVGELRRQMWRLGETRCRCPPASLARVRPPPPRRRGRAPRRRGERARPASMSMTAVRVGVGAGGVVEGQRPARWRRVHGHLAERHPDVGEGARPARIDLARAGALARWGCWPVRHLGLGREACSWAGSRAGRMRERHGDCGVTDPRASGGAPRVPLPSPA